MNKQQKIYIARLRKLGNYLIDEVKPDAFNMRDWVTEVESTGNGHTCGTVCCALGWMPKVSKSWSWVSGDIYPGIHPVMKSLGGLPSPSESAIKWFGIECANTPDGCYDDAVDALFMPYWYSIAGKIQPMTVGQRILRVADNLENERKMLDKVKHFPKDASMYLTLIHFPLSSQ